MDSLFGAGNGAAPGVTPRYRAGRLEVENIFSRRRCIERISDLISGRKEKTGAWRTRHAVQFGGIKNIDGTAMGDAIERAVLARSAADSELDRVGNGGAEEEGGVVEVHLDGYGF